MSLRPYSQSNRPVRPGWARGLLLGGVSLAAIAVAMPARAGTITYGDGDDRATPIVMTEDMIGAVSVDEAATQSGVISGAHKFIKAGFGSLTLSGNNTYSGGTDLNMGSLRLKTQTALGTGMLTMADGTRLIADSSVTFSLSNAIQLDGVVEIGGISLNNQVNLDGAISGTGRLVLTSRAMLSGDNTYSGGTDVFGQAFVLGANALGTGAVTLANDATLIFSSASYSNDIVVAGAKGRFDTSKEGSVAILDGVVSGAGQLINSGPGRVVLTAANTYSGGTLIDGGELVAEHDQALGSGAVSFIGLGRLTYGDGVNVHNILSPTDARTTILQVAAGETATQSGAITGSALAGGYYKRGAGELVLMGAASFGGDTNLDEGSLTAGAENVLAARSMHVLASNTRLNLLANQEVGGIKASGTIDLGDNTLLLNGTREDSFVSGELIGGAQSSLEKTGGNKLFLDGDNESYAGFLLGLSGDVVVRGDYSGLRTHMAAGSLSSGGTTTGRLGDVSVSDATLYGQSGSQLTMDSLSMTRFATIHAALGAPGAAPALFNINGNLTLNGTLDVEDLGGFGPGVYRLFDYGGTLTNDGLVIGSGPDGYGPDQLTLQTSVAHQVNLVADDVGHGEIAFWDGGDSTLWNNAVVNGGAGRWTRHGGTFTDANGIVNGSMDPFPGFAVFQGAAGMVTVDNSTGQIQSRGMQFATDGYHLTGEFIDLVAGEAVIRVGDGTAAGAGYTATISNTLDGAGRLVKSDLGTLVLEGDNTYWGGTEVRQGTLLVDGSIGEVDVGTNGRLGGNGTVGTATVSGTITGGKTIGTLSVDGNLTMQEGSTLEVKVDAAGNSDRVDVTGSAYLYGGKVVSLASGGNYADQTSYTILTAQGGVYGTFADVTSNLAFLDASLAYGDNDVKLTLARNGTTFENVGLTRNQVATGGGVEGLGSGNPLYDRVLTLSAADARFAFDRLSGEIHASAKGVLLEDSRFVRDIANDRIRSAFNGVGARTMSPVLAYGEGGPEAAPSPGDRFAVWSQAFGSWGTARGDGNAAGLDRSTGGLLFGADAALDDSWRIGMLAGYSHTSFQVDDRASSGSSSNYHLGLYGGGQWGAFGLRGGAAYSWSRLDIGRAVAFPGFEDSLTAKYDAGTAQMFGEAGYRVDTLRGSFEPFANLAYVSMHSGAFAESGGAAALSGAGNTTDATFTTLGLRGQAEFALGGVATTARGMLGWRHAFGDVTPLAPVAFDGGDAFTVAGVPIASNAAVIEAGLDFAVTPMATLGVSYTGQLASRAKDHAVKADVSVRF
ncbi:autotransporter domain-containing protein [Mesorhizobium sp.]|uniref:autotransporter outer membrane beta-barrel domain-containing protein n=1 Tax=Mesorhizobium sp. TaxID=1871066 RepID=UPI003BAAB6E8